MDIVLDWWNLGNSKRSLLLLHWVYRKVSVFNDFIDHTRHNAKCLPQNSNFPFSFNFRFRIDNTDHIIDVNKGNLAFEYDQVHIICPVYEPGTFDNETEKYIIYNVSKVEYETCRITNANPRIIAICDKPQKLMFFTITFRPFTPQPGGLEFLPGNDYYFICMCFLIFSVAFTNCKL